MKVVGSVVARVVPERMEAEEDIVVLSRCIDSSIFGVVELTCCDVCSAAVDSRI